MKRRKKKRKKKVENKMELEKKMVGIRKKLKKRLMLNISERNIWFKYVNIVLDEVLNRKIK